MRRLWFKLSLTFIALLIVAIGAVGFLINRSVTEQFQLYVNRGNQMRAAMLAPFFADYYQRQGSWEGVESLLADGPPMMGMMDMDMMAMMGTMEMPMKEMRGMREMMGMKEMREMMEMMGMMDMGMMDMGQTTRGKNNHSAAEAPTINSPPIRERLILADVHDQVIIDSWAEIDAEVPSVLPSEALAVGQPIIVAGEQVGILLVTWGELSGFSRLDQEFLSAVNRSLLWVGALVSGLALVLGTLFSWQMTASLRQLRQVATAISQGDLSQRVTTLHNDDIGELGRTFNQMTHALQQQEKLRRHMLADIAHELRTPLSLIRGNLEGILDEVYPADLQQIASIHSETLLLQRLVEDLRELSLAEAGQLELNKRELDVEKLIQEAIEAVKESARQKGVILKNSTQPALMLIGDQKRLSQVLLNLLNNALRHTPAGGQVTVQSWLDHQMVTVAVADTGSGIPPEHLPHIFERFYRVDKSRSRSEGGSGIGLTITKQLVEAHGGTIQATSAGLGQGSIFTFTLPRQSSPKIHN